MTDKLLAIWSSPILNIALWQLAQIV